MNRIRFALSLVCWQRRALASILLILTIPAATGCEKKSPPDPNIQRGYSLLSSDPQAAFEALSQAKNQSSPEVLLGLGVALEGLRRYEEAEPLLIRASAKADIIFRLRSRWLAFRSLWGKWLKRALWSTRLS